MRFKKYIKCLISTLVVLTIVLGLTSCGKSKTEQQDEAIKENKDTTSENNSNENPYEDLKIGMIITGKSTDTSGYTFAHVSGMKKAATNLGIKESNIIFKDNTIHNYNEETDALSEKAIQECIDSGCKVIFSMSSEVAMKKMAEKNPNIYFAHALGSLANGSNFINYFGRIYQARYLSGIAAGLKTKTNKIGYVSAWGVDNAECTSGINAFAMGVASVNPNAKVYVRTTNSWFDEKLEKDAAKWLIEHDADVIAQHCNTPQPQIAAQEANVYGVGYSSDMSENAPNATLVSVLWDWSAFYSWACQAIVENKWTGENYFGGLREGMVTLSDLASFNNPEAVTKIKEATDKMVNRSWDVFYDVIPTNTGKTIGEANRYLDDETIISKINWYYKNVKSVN